MKSPSAEASTGCPGVCLDEGVFQGRNDLANLAWNARDSFTIQQLRLGHGTRGRGLRVL